MTLSDFETAFFYFRRKLRYWPDYISTGR